MGRSVAGAPGRSPAEQDASLLTASVAERKLCFEPLERVRIDVADVSEGRVARAAMIHLPASVRLYVATSPCVVQRSFDGLHALVNTVMQLDAVAGHLFVFANRL